MSLNKKIGEAQVLYYSMDDLESETFNVGLIVGNAYFNGERSERIVKVDVSKGYEKREKVSRSDYPIALL